MNNVIKYEKLVTKIASKYSNYTDFEDLRQAGMIGLMKALDKYTPNPNTKFSTYAYFWIKGEILEEIRKDRNIKLSKEVVSLNKEINICKDILRNRLNKEPTNTEIAFYLEKDIKDIEDAIIANELILSCDYTVADSENETNLYDCIPYKEKMYESDILDLYNAIDNLSIDEQKLIRMRYFEDMTQKEVSEIFGTNQVNISRKEEKILNKLNKSLVV